MSALQEPLPEKSPADISLEKLRGSLASGEAMTKAEQDLSDYFIKAGVVPEPGIPMDKAVANQKRRNDFYLNVTALMSNYRSLRNLRDVFREELAARISVEPGQENIEMATAEGKGLFDALSERLELLAVQNEKRFQAIYAPQIMAGRRIEAAMNAVDYGLKILKAKDESLYQLIMVLFVDGNVKPRIQDVQKALHIPSPTSFYSKRKKALELLTRNIWGFSSDKEELFSLLLYLRQLEEDEDFLHGDD